MNKKIYMSLAILVGCTSLSGCDNSETASILNNGWRSASSGSLELRFEQFSSYSQAFEQARLILHAADAQTILGDVDLLRSNGVANFGNPPEGPVHLSLAIAFEGFDFWTIDSLLDFPRGRYRIPLPQPFEGAADLRVDVAADAQALPRGASLAGASADSISSIVQGMTPSQDRVEFMDIPARQRPGAILAWASDADSSQVVFSLMREEELMDNASYTLVADQPALGLDVSQRQAQTSISGVSRIPGLVVGPRAFLDADNNSPNLNILTGISGEQVLLAARREATDPDFDWFRLETWQATPSSYAPNFWEVGLNLAEYDRSNFSLAFEQTAASPGMAASSCGTDGEGLWCVYAPPAWQQLQLPRLPEDLAANIDRSAISGLRENFQYIDEDSYSSYHAWVRDNIEGNYEFAGLSLLTVAPEQTIGGPGRNCLLEIAVIDLCIGLNAPESDGGLLPQSTRPTVHRPRLVPREVLDPSIPNF